MVVSLEYDAIVVGAGPNGLAAAITMAQAGCKTLVVEAKDTIGGGMRSSYLTLDGFLHDRCSAIHPMGVASPFFRSLNLDAKGIEWIHSPVPLAHPLDDGTAVLLERSLDVTADGLGSDARSYRNLMSLVAGSWDKLIEEILGPLHFPRHPLALGRFGLIASQSVDSLVRSRFKPARARALFAGIEAHSIMPMDRAGGAAVGLLLGAAGHAVGWPMAKGGSQSIADAMKRCLVALGGEIRTGVEVRAFDELPLAKTVLFDLTPRQIGVIAANGLPQGYRRRLLEHQFGPGVFKMDWALAGPIPWKAPSCLRAATVHLGGTFEEIAEAEDTVWKGQHPNKPLVILAQQSLFDPTRAPEGKQIAWAYCHVPNGSNIDMSERIEAQIERFAPGFRERILARSVMNTAAMEEYNSNYIGGDIAGGIQNPFRLFLRPLGRWRAYATPVKGIYICSSSMPPGSGVHGMCGYHAARLALREFRRYAANNIAGMPGGFNE